MQIWTFWEPRGKMPYYLRLCMKTWAKFLPEAEITLLDSTNIQNYINISEFGANLTSGRFSLPQIADAIRVMLLEKHGGIWLDADTIILDRSAKNYFKDNTKPVSFFGNVENRTCHIAFIKSKPSSKCLTSWLDFIKTQLSKLNTTIPVGWDFFGNSFLDSYSKLNVEEVAIFDRNLVMPEFEVITNADFSGNARRIAYMKYYFLQSRHIEDIPNDMLLLHNSWTPADFINMGEDKFLRCDFTMANILMAALDMKRNRRESPIRFNQN